MELYTMSNWGLFQGCKAGSIFENQRNPPLSTGFTEDRIN